MKYGRPIGICISSNVDVIMSETEEGDARSSSALPNCVQPLFSIR